MAAAGIAKGEAPTRTVPGAGGVPAAIWVACSSSACHAFAVQRRVYLHQAAPGVIAWPTLLCAGCGSVLGLPHPWNALEENIMPKISVHGGPTNAADPDVPAVDAEPVPAETTDAPAAQTATAAEAAPAKPAAKKNIPAPAAPRKKAGNG